VEVRGSRSDGLRLAQEKIMIPYLKIIFKKLTQKNWEGVWLEWYRDSLASVRP
jgi:hypothetical protein